MGIANQNDRPYTLPLKYVSGRIGVVTVTYNSGTVLPEFLHSIEQQTHQDFLLYAVDNASSDDSLDQLRGWGDPRLIMAPNPENLGVAAGNNQGIRAALEDGCEYVLLLNNDVVFGAELMQQLQDGIAEHRCSMTTPLIYFCEPRDVIWCAGGYFQPKLAFRSLHYGENQQDVGQCKRARAVTYAPTCCVLIHREVFGRIGLMDERYFVYSDDTDLMLRAWKGDEALWYLPEAKLWHKVNSLTGKASPFSMRYGARNRAFFIAKHVRGAYGVLFQWLYAFYYLLRFILRKDTRAAYDIKRMAWAEGRRMAL
jgi:GT2 family glycosyltransferase